MLSIIREQLTHYQTQTAPIHQKFHILLFYTRIISNKLYCIIENYIGMGKLFDVDNGLQLLFNGKSFQKKENGEEFTNVECRL